MENNLHRVCFREPMSMVSLWRKLSSVCKNNSSRDSRGQHRGQLESLCLETLSTTTCAGVIFRSQTSKELSISVICKLQKTQIPVLSEPSCTKADAWYQGPYSAMVLTRSLWVEHCDAHCGSAMQDVVQRSPVKPSKNWCLPPWMDWAETDSATRSTRSYQHRTALLLQSVYQEAI